MNVKQIRLSDLKPPEKNVRIHSQKQMQEYVHSVRKFGQTKPIVCDENYQILAGNGLYEALKADGSETAWCNVISGLSDADKKKLMLADNKVYELGITDFDAIDEILASLNGDFDIPGYDNNMLDLLTMDTTDADSFVESYGAFDAEQVQKIRENEMQTAQVPVRPQIVSPVPNSGDVTQAQDLPGEIESERYVICPHCGGRICL